MIVRVALAWTGRKKSKRGERPTGWATGAQEIVDRVFVYGTLLSGQGMRSMIADHVTACEPATMKGRIYAMPEGYPGMVDDGAEDIIVGEMVTLDDLAAAFALLDAYEGADFTRILKAAKLADGSDSWSWVYVLSDPNLAGNGELIASGDWVDHVAD
jgi:gamma-glutamylcyclotransferase (GGCT)/AIG2-like uncharacterized protein YtfP